MTNVKLHLSISEANLIEITRDRLKIVLAKPLTDHQSIPNVNWLVFAPFIDNVIEWTEIYGLYASDVQSVQNGTFISKNSDRYPAIDGVLYRYDASFHGPFTKPDVPPAGTFQVMNELQSITDSSVLFGLEQSATINGNVIAPSVISAAETPYNYSAQFTPSTNVWVWLQSDTSWGTYNTQHLNEDVIKSSITVVSFSTTTEQSLTYDAALGKFV